MASVNAAQKVFPYLRFILAVLFDRMFRRRRKAADSR
jgi:hypothetical protein